MRCEEKIVAKRSRENVSFIEGGRSGYANGLRCAAFTVAFLFTGTMGLQAQQPNVSGSTAPIKKVTTIKAQPSEVNVLPARIVITSDDVKAFASRLREFSNGLSGAERDLFYSLLARAGGAPSDAPEGTDVKMRLFTAGMRRDGEEKPSGVSVPGGVGVSRGAIESSPVAVLREMLGPGNVSIGPKQDDPRAKGSGVLEIGPKQDDPRARPKGSGVLEIGPKQDDPRAKGSGVLEIGPKQDDPRSPSSTLADKMHAFGSGSSVKERAMLDWLMQRADSSQSKDAKSPGGPRPSPERLVFAALGVEAIGPKQDDPSPRPSSQSWTLRF